MRFLLGVALHAIYLVSIPSIDFSAKLKATARDGWFDGKMHDPCGRVKVKLISLFMDTR
jgi:hypothetical protein